jgi:Tol biopolymer transport system component
MHSSRAAATGAVFLTFALAGCASSPRSKVEFPKTPMGIGQVSIDAVTNDADQESVLRISPDGRFLLFNVVSAARARGGRFSFLENLRSSGGDQQLAAFYQQNSISLIELGKAGRTVVSQEGASDPAWFPDNRTFVFSMLQGRQAMLATSSVGQGTSAVRFVAPTPCVAYDRLPSVSPNGQTILFSTATASEGATVATMELRSSESKCKILFPGQSAQWAPFGRKFAFTRVVGGHYQVFTFDESRNLLTQITFGSFDNFEPTWSANGGSIAFTSTRNGAADIYTIREDGSSLIQITQGPTTDRYPTWARDGSIYFVSNAGGQTDVWKATIGTR